MLFNICLLHYFLIMWVKVWLSMAYWTTIMNQKKRHIISKASTVNRIMHHWEKLLNFCIEHGVLWGTLLKFLAAVASHSNNQAIIDSQNLDKDCIFDEYIFLWLLLYCCHNEKYYLVMVFLLPLYPFFVAGDANNITAASCGEIFCSS